MAHDSNPERLIMPTKFLKIAAFLLFFSPAAQATEPETRFLFPVSCSLSEDCWTVNYNDSDPAENAAKDYTCGPRTYDGHDGTDFAVRDETVMRGGIDVLSAADGKIMRVRDEIEDREPSAEDMAKMKEEKKGCGNGVLIDHGKGWQTIYCHMKKDSMVVKVGDKVATGQKIGQVGQSGMAEFPHLHFGVFKDGKIIDPFTGRQNGGDCGKENNPLWLEGLAMDYEPLVLYAVGFEPGVPEFEKIKKNADGSESLPMTLEALTFWVTMFGVVEGDKISMTITDANGSIFATRDIVQDKTRARQFYFVGKKTQGKNLFPGTYKGKTTVIRTLSDGTSINKEIERAVEIAP